MLLERFRAEPVVGAGGAAPLVVGMRLDLLCGLGDDRGDVLVADEQQDRGLAVAPDQVLDDLPEGVVDRARAAPDFAFTDEDVAILDTDDDVRLGSSYWDPYSCWR